MKILIVTPCFYPAHIYGGPIEVSYHCGKSWAEQGHKVMVVTTNANGKNVLVVETNKPLKISGMLVYYCKRTCLSTVSFGQITSLWSQIINTDVVVLHFVYSFSTIPTIVLSKIFNKKLIWRPHGALQAWPGTKKRWLKKQWNKLCELFLPLNTVVVFTSKRESDESGDVFNHAKKIVVPNGVTASSSISIKKYSKTTRLLYLGRIDPIKGLENLLNSMLKIDSTRFTLDIYGQGEPDYVEKIRCFIFSHQLNDRVFMRGGTPHENISQIFLSSDILVLPSFTENFGQVVVEALAYGVPVIVSRNAPWKEIETIGCGLWVQNDPESLASAIVKMSSLDLTAMGNRGRDWVLNEFDWSKNAKKIIDSVDNLEARRLM